MSLRPLGIPGCFLMKLISTLDHRGRFIKNYQERWFIDVGIIPNFVEEYYTISHHGVLRGLHFQRPPHDLSKMVYCVRGEVFDVIVDLRKGSPWYGKFEMLTLSESNDTGLYLAPGIAHGFLVTGSEAILQYKVTSYYHQEADDGIRWDSVGIPWPEQISIISERDQRFVEFSEFDSPFSFDVPREGA